MKFFKPGGAAAPPASYAYVNRPTTISKSATIVQCFVCQSIYVFRFDLLHLRNFTLTHVCFPNIQCIYSAKSFSFGNLSLLTNFQKLSTVWSNTNCALLLKGVMLVLIKIRQHTAGMGN